MYLLVYRDLYTTLIKGSEKESPDNLKFLLIQSTYERTYLQAPLIDRFYLFAITVPTIIIIIGIIMIMIIVIIIIIIIIIIMIIIVMIIMI